MKRALYKSARIAAGALLFFLLAATFGIDRADRLAGEARVEILVTEASVGPR